MKYIVNKKFSKIFAVSYYRNFEKGFERDEGFKREMSRNILINSIRRKKHD